MIQIFHNNRCTKSRNCLVFLNDSKKEIQVINYLENPPTFEELETIIKKLKVKPIDVVRKGETIWKTEYKSKTLSDKQIIEAMIKNPILIERPIVINGDKAAIGRPIEKVYEIL